MKKKLMFLAAALAICSVSLPSCSKDDEPQQTVQTVSVANTVWRASDGTTYKFYSDGTCSLGSGAVSKYHQVGSEINFNGELAWYNGKLYHASYGRVKGSVMQVELYFVGEPRFTVNFYKVG